MRYDERRNWGCTGWSIRSTEQSRFIKETTIYREPSPDGEQRLQGRSFMSPYFERCTSPGAIPGFYVEGISRRMPLAEYT